MTGRVRTVLKNVTPKSFVLLVPAIVLGGCVKHVDIAKLDGDWTCTEVVDGTKGMVTPMAFHDGQFNWTIPSRSPTVSTLVRARYTIAGTTLSMPDLYLHVTGIPFNDSPGWSQSERSVVTGIEELNDTKLVLAPWKTTSSQRKLDDHDLRYECVRPAAASQSASAAPAERGASQEEQKPDAGSPPAADLAGAVSQAPTPPSESRLPPAEAAPNNDPLTFLIKLPIPGHTNDWDQVGVTIQPRTPQDHVRISAWEDKIRAISRAVLGHALQTPGTVLIDNQRLADQLHAELCRQLQSDFIETLTLDDVDAGAD